ncbi:hypothetical protein PDL71_10905 [Lacibacter sp. MH-610]|jgi:hypothetical protein|uniref:hypothetical protein n=1 Tax=Chitinophagaceae TaxID=563835 RepID=UPI001ACA1FDB|nr:hypothetical protein [Chitinophagales bacterium]
MDWYLPITIIPGVGVLIVSTTNQIIALNIDIAQMISNKSCMEQMRIFDKKNNQLKKLARATVLFYISSALYVFSGLSGAFMSSRGVSEVVLIAATACLFAALGYLIFYGHDLIKIQKIQVEQIKNTKQ